MLMSRILKVVVDYAQGNFPSSLVPYWPFFPMGVVSVPFKSTVSTILTSAITKLIIILGHGSWNILIVHVFYAPVLYVNIQQSPMRFLLPIIMCIFSRSSVAQCIKHIIRTYSNMYVCARYSLIYSNTPWGIKATQTVSAGSKFLISISCPINKYMYSSR